MAVHASLAWWDRDLSGDERLSRLNNVIGRLQSQQQARFTRAARYARLYRASTTLAGTSIQYDRPKLAYNVVKSCVDTWVSKMCKEDPKTTIVTSGARFDLQRKVEDANTYLEGLNRNKGVYDLRPIVLKDAAIYGNGYYKPCIVGVTRDGKNADIAVDRVMFWEVLVDDAEAIRGEPRCVYQTKVVDRGTLAAQYRHQKKLRYAIESAQFNFKEEWFSAISYHESIADPILVTEAWCKPSGPGADDGVHLIALQNEFLVEPEEWAYHYVPLIPMQKEAPPEGYYGIGIAEELEGIQLEINELCEQIRRAQRLMSAAHWLIEGNTTLSTRMNSEIGSEIRFVGAPPTPILPPAVHPEIYQQVDRLYQKAFEITGISQLASQGQKPAGLNSGKALRTYAEMQSERFAEAGKRDQKVIVELNRQMLDLSKEIVDKYNPEYTVDTYSREGAKRVAFFDLKLQSGSYKVQAWPTNLLSGDPASKMEQVLEWANSGAISPEDAMRLVDAPDLRMYRERNLASASDDLIFRQLEAILYDGKYTSPIPAVNLDRASQFAQVYRLRAELDNAPQERRAMLDMWGENVEALKNPPPPPGAPPPEPPLPPGPEQPPPPMPGEPMPMPDGMTDMPAMTDLPPPEPVA